MKFACALPHGGTINNTMGEVMFSCPVEKCDVERKDALAKYRAKLQIWHALLFDDVEHSIFSQYTDMMWHDAAWRIVNEARRFTIDDGPSSAISPILGKLIDHGYAMTQVVAVSKLLEKSDPLHPKKAVISIRRVVDEIIEHRGLFTREIFVSHDGIPYDWTPSPESSSSDQIEWVGQDGSNGRMLASLKHLHFDKLSGVAKSNRSRDDKVSKAIFDRLSDQLNDPVFEEIRNLRNKRIAHAADANSRAQITNLRKSLKFSELEKAHKILTGVLQAISQGLLFGKFVGTSVPTEQPEAFEHLELPFVQSSRTKETYQLWCDHVREREGWLTSAYHETIPELA